MLLQRGHTKAVDWWCLGLLMHEMLTGRHPFQGSTHYDTLRAMVCVCVCACEVCVYGCAHVHAVRV